MKNKVFLTIEEQIDLLKSRGLIISNDEFSKKVLLNTSYFRLSGYTLTLRKNDVFYPGTTIENVLELYCFDRCLRRLILDFSEIIEVEMRTHIAYHHAEGHGKLGYLIPDNFSDHNYAETFINDLWAEIVRSKEVFVKHYREAYSDVFPIWVAIELVGFGDLSRLYANLLPEEKSFIVKEYYGVKEKYVENWLRCASELRNICAHRGRLYNRPLPSGVQLFSEHSSLNNKMFFAYFIAILKLLDPNDRNRCIEAFKTIKSQYPFPLMEHLGAPTDWEKVLGYLK